MSKFHIGERVRILRTGAYRLNENRRTGTIIVETVFPGFYAVEVDNTNGKRFTFSEADLEFESKEQEEFSRKKSPYTVEFEYRLGDRVTMKDAYYDRDGKPRGGTVTEIMLVTSDNLPVYKVVLDGGSGRVILPFAGEELKPE